MLFSTHKHMTRSVKAISFVHTHQLRNNIVPKLKLVLWPPHSHHTKLKSKKSGVLGFNHLWNFNYVVTTQWQRN